MSYYILATLAVTNNQFTTAIKYLESAIQITKGKEELSPSADLNMSRIYLELGCCRSAAGDYQGAEAEFIRSIECNASDALPHLLLGNCRFMRGDLAGARDMYERTLVLDPSREDAQRGLTLCCGRE